MRRLVPFTLLGLVLLGATAHANDAAPHGAPGSRRAPAPASAQDRAVDRLELDTTAVTGNRELPKVMSIVPWKAAEPPSGPDRPMGSLIEELLTPLDPDVFRREIAYWRDLSSPHPTTASTPRSQAEP